jgi:hypothetical protein
MKRAAEGNATGDAVGNGQAGAVIRDLASFGEITADMLRAVFPAQWRIFESGGVWWATRGGLQERTARSPC